MIPPLVSYTTIDQFVVDLEEALRRSRAKFPKPNPITTASSIEEARALWAKGLPPIVSRRAFALLFGVSPRLIPRMMSAPEIYWREFKIPKRSGGFRTIQTPRVFLKTFQYYILHNILARGIISEKAYGFTRGRGCHTNATQHLHNRFVLNVDLKDFFPSVGYKKVEGLFKAFAYNDEASGTLASLCTLNGVLPQGAPTSPRIADLVFEPVDQLLSTIGDEYGATYTRYADDLTYSAPEPLPADLLTRIVGAVDRLGFRINHEKTRSSGPGMKRKVTGFVINEKVHPERQIRRILRAKFHRISLSGEVDWDQLVKAQGWASYVYAYDQQRGAEYLELVKAARLALIRKETGT